MHKINIILKYFRIILINCFIMLVMSCILFPEDIMVYDPAKYSTNSTKQQIFKSTSTNSENNNYKKSYSNRTNRSNTYRRGRSNTYKRSRRLGNYSPPPRLYQSNACKDNTPCIALCDEIFNISAHAQQCYKNHIQNVQSMHATYVFLKNPSNLNLINAASLNALLSIDLNFMINLISAYDASKAKMLLTTIATSTGISQIIYDRDPDFKILNVLLSKLDPDDSIKAIKTKISSNKTFLDLAANLGVDTGAFNWIYNFIKNESATIPLLQINYCRISYVGDWSSRSAQTESHYNNINPATKTKITQKSIDDAGSPKIYFGLFCSNVNIKLTPSD